MELDEYVEHFHAAEQTTNVTAWNFRGIPLWPLFRVQAIAAIKSPESYFGSKKKDQVKAGWKDWFYRFRFRKEALADIRRQLADKSVNVLFYVKPGQHKDLIGDKLYDRFIDPFIELEGGGRTSIKMQFRSHEDDQNTNRLFPAELIDDTAFKRYWHYYRKTQHVDLLAVFEEMQKVSGIRFNYARFQSAVEESWYYRELFKVVLSEINPSAIFFQGYYENDTFGLMAAAKEQRRITVDIQHGKQGIVHPMYTHWTQLPDNGYCILPSVFWNWGEESAINISRWFPSGQTAHRTVVGGNLWLMKWKHEDCFRPNISEQNFIESLKQSGKVILYTLQPLENGICPPELLEAIRNSPADWKWLFRSHPFHKVDKEDLEFVLGEMHSRVECDFASSLPLYYLLRHVDHHITLWSSTCFEAAALNVPTIIAHELGGRLYRSQIEEGVFTYADTSGSIIEQISHAKPPAATVYIETDREIAKQALSSVLN
jgi:hypothetical protein